MKSRAALFTLLCAALLTTAVLVSPAPGVGSGHGAIGQAARHRGDRRLDLG